MADSPATPTLPDGCRIYAIGDIHGRADLLGRMTDLIERDLLARPVAETTTVCLGDYVDRGPASAAVIDRLARADFPTPLVTLGGNHEDVFQSFLRGDVDIGSYRQMGGEATLSSYGLDLSHLARLRPGDRADALRAAVPPSHRRFLDETRLSHAVGGYFFCHAGVRPGVPLDRQTKEDLLWIREAFLASTVDFGATVVHGHTPVPRPDRRTNRINVDTKAFASGVLTAVVLEGTQQRFLRT